MYSNRDRNNEMFMGFTWFGSGTDGKSVRKYVFEGRKYYMVVQVVLCILFG